MNVGSLTSVERIGAFCFAHSGVEEMSIPDSVVELGGWCFNRCGRLRRVTFRSSSCLERIGELCFGASGMIELKIPGAVGVIGGGAFSDCPLSGGLVCDGCQFSAVDGLVVSLDCERCFGSYGVLLSVCIPDSVRELCDYCFKGCKSLRRVTFGSVSSLERIGASCFEATPLKKVSIPNSVRELCDRCFKGCESLACVTFGSSPSLDRIGDCCFEGTQVEDLSIPDSASDVSRYIYGPIMLYDAFLGESWDYPPS